MKRVFTKHLLMLLPLLLLCSFLSAQTTVEIATGPVLTPVYNSGPVYRSSASSAYDFCRYAYMYTQDELTAVNINNGASISNLAWNQTSVQGTTGPGQFKIYMKNTSNTAYTVSTAWADLINGATLVFDQGVTIPANSPGYLDFQLASNFTYTGGTLEIYVDWDISAVSGNASTGALAWALNTVVDKILGVSSSTLAGVATLSTTTNSINTIDNTRPAIQITTGGAPPACPAPTGVNASGTTTTSTNLAWTPQGGATMWDVYLSTSISAPNAGTTPTFNDVTANPFALTNLPSGTTHYAWVRSDCAGSGTSSWSGPATFTTLITNDDCANATTLSVSTDLTCTTGISGTTLGATQSTGTAPTCSATGINDDVWFSFVATSTSHTVQITGATNTTAAQIYGGTCPALTTIVCGSTSSGTANVTATGLTVGQTYYIRVYTTVTTVGTTSNFTICVLTPPTAPANDDCAGASVMAVSSFGSCVPRFVNTTSATQTATPVPSCTSTGNNDDVWYTFTTNAAGDYRFSYSGLTATSGTASTVGFDIYSGDCSSLTPVSGVCNAGFGSGGSGFRYATLAASTTYYLRLWVGSTSNTGTFNFCIEEMPALPNNECAGAVAMPAIPTNGSCSTVAGTTYGSTESLAGCVGTANDDVWYSFVATQEAHVIECTGVTGGPATDMVFQVFSGSCGSLTSLLCSDPATGTVGGLTIGNTYYVRVYTYSSTLTIYADFTLCVKNAPDMTYVSSTATHPLTTTVSSGESNVQILRTSVVVIGASNPLSVTELVYNMNGTTNPSDVTAARVYYTGTSTTFNTNNQFGTAIANPNGTLTFTGSQNLAGGTSNTTNYFWLVYDVACGAPTGNLLDAECTSVTVGGTPQTPTTTAPTGTRSILALASYSTAQAGNWDDPATWACGVPPNGATVPVNINHAVTLNVNADINDSLIINSGGVLTVMANTLTLGDIATNDGGNEMLITNSGGGLVLGGTGRIKVNGTVKFNAGSSFDMDGGSSLDIDPNGAGGSVTTTSIYMLHILTNDVSIGGGVITIVDPHPGTSGYAFYYSATGSVITTGGTIRFGDGVSTTMGGSATNGFYLFPGSSGANRVYFYNIEVKGQPAQNRHTRNLYDLIAQNSLTIDAGCELRHADDVYIYKNLVNNGGLIGTSTTYYLYLAEHSSTGTPISSANVVSITGNGTFANNTTGATANMYNLHVDNTSGTPIAIPANMITGVGTSSVSTNLRLVNGKLNLQGNTLTLGLSTTSRGTLNGTITSPAGYMYNGKFQRWIGTVTGPSVYPIGTSADPRWTSVNYTTAPTAGGTLAFEFKEVAPGNNGLPATDTSGASPTLGTMCPDGFWEATNGGVAGGVYSMDLGTDGMACITNIANARILKRTDASSPWELHGAHADGSGTTAKRTGIPSGFSDFGVSQGASLQTYYADLDGDGYGDPNNTILAATAPGGYVSNDDDCDDSNPNLPTIFYADTDGDSYGVAGGGTTLACATPPGFSPNDEDCNDSNPAINPGATEVCGNGVDENCDTFTGVSDFVGDLTPSCVNPAKNIITVGSIAGGPAPFT
ncbi:MAG: MopE-related protein, partial [Saprospiraceae bacterium]